MKTKSLIILACISFTTLGIYSCSKLKSLLQYNLNMQTASYSFTIPITSDTSKVNSLGNVSLSYNIDSFIKASTSNVLGLSNITSAKVNSVVFTLQNPDTANNFANIQNATVTFTSNASNTPYTLGGISNNPDVYAYTLNLQVDSTQNLISYISPTTNQFNYSISAKLRRPTTDTLNCTVTVQFSVHVQG